MPKNIKGGKGHKKGKNSVVPERRSLLLKDGPDQQYGLIIKVLGEARFMLVCPNAKQHLSHARGKMRCRQWIRIGDLVLFTYRDTTSAKVDIIHKYNDEQAKQIKRVENLIFPEGDNPNSKQNSTIVFDADSDEDDEMKRVAAAQNDSGPKGYDRVMGMINASSDNDDEELLDEEDYEIVSDSELKADANSDDESESDDATGDEDDAAGDADSDASDADAADSGSSSDIDKVSIVKKKRASAVPAAAATGPIIVKKKRINAAPTAADLLGKDGDAIIDIDNI